MRLIILRLTMGDIPGTRTELEAIIQYSRSDNEAEKKVCWMRGFIFQGKNTADDAVSTIVINVSQNCTVIVKIEPAGKCLRLK